MSRFNRYAESSKKKSENNQLQFTKVEVEDVSKSTQSNKTPKKYKTKKRTLDKIVRTYRLSTTVIEEMEEHFMDNRLKINIGDYISGLIYQDLHNGEKLFDEKTGALLRDIDEQI